MTDCINPKCDNKEKSGKLCEECFDKYMTDVQFAKKIHRIEGDKAQ